MWASTSAAGSVHRGLMSPMHSDLALTQVLTVFTDREAGVQRQERGQAWGRELNMGCPSRPGQAPPSACRGPPRRVRLEVDDTLIVTHAIAHMCAMCLPCVLHGTDLWPPRRVSLVCAWEPSLDGVVCSAFSGWEVSRSSEQRNKTCPAWGRPERWTVSSGVGRPRGWGLGGGGFWVVGCSEQRYGREGGGLQPPGLLARLHGLGSHLRPAWLPSGPGKLMGHNSPALVSPRRWGYSMGL